jgi:hypothetical protein
MRTNGLDDSPFTSHGTSSTALLHNLYEKIERQSQVLYLPNVQTTYIYVSDLFSIFSFTIGEWTFAL